MYKLLSLYLIFRRYYFANIALVFGRIYLENLAFVSEPEERTTITLTLVSFTSN